LNSQSHGYCGSCWIDFEWIRYLKSKHKNALQK
jgi:hypothetical protein